MLRCGGPNGCTACSPGSRSCSVRSATPPGGIPSRTTCCRRRSRATAVLGESEATRCAVRRDAGVPRFARPTTKAPRGPGMLPRTRSRRPGTALGLEVLLDRIHGCPATKQETIHRIRRGWALPRWRLAAAVHRRLCWRRPCRPAHWCGILPLPPTERDEGAETLRTLPELERVVDGLDMS